MLFSFQLSSQRIIPDEKILDYSCEDKDLRTVLYDLSELANVTIAWQEQIIPVDSMVTVSFRKERLGKIIDYLILEHELKYKIVGNQIAIIKDKLAKVSDEVTISGYLKDAESGEALISANIYLYDRSLGTVTNEYGFYSFTVPKGLQRIYYSYLGYDLGIEEINADQDIEYNKELFPSNYLKEIIITETKLTPIPLNAPEVSSVNVLSINQLNSFLPLGGEPDIMRLAMSMPGVTSGSDGFGGMSVRGGATNQNLILFDGIPVYNAEHAFGLFSIFNSRVIKSAKIYKGAFPSHYSGRLSSVLDIRTREGNYRKLSGEVSVGLLSGSAAIEGPIIKEKASFLFSARRTFVDPWIGALSREFNQRIGKEGQTDFYFYDINGKVNFNLGKSSKIYFSYYRGNDFFENDVSASTEDNNRIFNDRDQVNWDIGNTLGVVRLSSRLSQKMFLNMNVYTSQYRFDSFDHDRLEQLRDNEEPIISYEAGYYQSRIQDLGGKVELDVIPNSKHRLKVGFGAIDHTFSPGLLIANQSDSLNMPGEDVNREDLRTALEETDLKGQELEFFVEDNISIGKHSTLNIGYNHMLVSSNGKSYSIPQPRILFSTGSENVTFKASVGRMAQFLHSLNNTGLGVPIDVWLPSTDQIEPETSVVFSTGVSYQRKSFGQFGFELFYKKMNNLTRYGNEGLIDISENSNWEERVPIGEGTAYGAEFSVNKTEGKTNFNFAYTLSWANRKFDEINNGETFRFRYDRRHVVNFNFIHRLNPNFEITANWEFGSGAPITIPTSQRFVEVNQVTGNPLYILIYEEVNNSNLPDYHRLDIGFNMISNYPWGRTVFSLGLYNAYNRQNPFYRDVVPNFTTGQLVFEDITILPILPTLSYSISF